MAAAAAVAPSRSRSRSPDKKSAEKDKRDRSRSKSPKKKNNYRELDSKCAKFWNASKLMQPILNKKERVALHDKLKIEFEKAVEYRPKARWHENVHLKTCLRCVVDGCVRIKGDIQCARCDYLHERYLSPTSIGDKTTDLWGFLCGTGLWNAEFTMCEARYLLYIAVRHAGIHGGEWDAAIRTEGIHLYPTEWMAREGVKIAKILPDDVMKASAERFDAKANQCIKEREDLGLPPEKDTRKTPGVYHGCSACDTDGTKLDPKTNLTLCCKAKPAPFSYCIEIVPRLNAFFLNVQMGVAATKIGDTKCDTYRILVVGERRHTGPVISKWIAEDPKSKNVEGTLPKEQVILLNRVYPFSPEMQEIAMQQMIKDHFKGAKRCYFSSEVMPRMSVLFYHEVWDVDSKTGKWTLYHGDTTKVHDTPNP